MRNIVGYALIRIALWLVLWYLLALSGVGVMLAGILAVLIAMMLSFLFLGRARENAAAGLQEADERRIEKRGPIHDEDAEAEDAVLDGTSRSAGKSGAAGASGAEADRDVDSKVADDDATGPGWAPRF